MRETRVRSLGREDPLEKEMATHSSTLAWKIPWKEEPGRLQSMGSQRVGHDWATALSLSQQWPQDWKRSVFIPIPKKSNDKECSNYCTIALISHESKIMLQFLQARLVKHLPAMWETWVRFLGWEFPLKKEMATHSSTLAWRIPWKEEPGRLQSMGLQRVGHNWATLLTYFTSIWWR